MKKNNTLVLFSSIVFVLSITLMACRCPVEKELTKSQIPANVLRKADQFIQAKTGNEFFEKYITIDFQQSIKIAPNYFMVYKLYIPEKPFVNEPIRFTTDSLGNVLKQFEIFGIPDCNSNPNDCDFVVDEKIAEQIANQNGLAKGIDNWKSDFLWNSNYNKYVWEIISTTKENKSTDYHRAEGEKIIIDAANASVLSKDYWKIN